MITTEGKSYVSDNILMEEELLEKVQALQKQGKKIGLCSGSFDLLHPGHITHLLAAKKECDILVVSVAPDEHNTRSRKQKGRPIFTHGLRAFAISQLKAVDFVLIHENSQQVIRILKPDVYIKGIDYNTLSDPVLMLEKEAVESHGGKIVFTSTNKLATTEIIKYIKEEIS
ncbi:MAG: adenylyltransferase/cytidyltransferase family protein [Nanoarchaeota archaeon]|nr:adenylyltransferase/cytidyltransferase family protein [Nanoarchaeota archaeon]